MKRNQFNLKHMIAGGDGGPSHLFGDCPHVKRKVVKIFYPLSPDANVLSLCRCHWCRGKYLQLQIEGSGITL